MRENDIERKVYTILLNDTHYGVLELLSFEDMVRKLFYRTGRRPEEVKDVLRGLKNKNLISYTQQHIDKIFHRRIS